MRSHFQNHELTDRKVIPMDTSEPSINETTAVIDDQS